VANICYTEPQRDHAPLHHQQRRIFEGGSYSSIELEKEGVWGCIAEKLSCIKTQQIALFYMRLILKS